MIQQIMKTVGPILPILGTAAVIYVGIQFALKYAPKLPFLNGGDGAVNVPLPQPSPMPGTNNPPAPVTNGGDDFNDVSDDYLFGDLLSI